MLAASACAGGAEDEVERRIARLLGDDRRLYRAEPVHVDPEIDNGVIDGRVPELVPEPLLGRVQQDWVVGHGVLRCHRQAELAHGLVAQVGGDRVHDVAPHMEMQVLVAAAGPDGRREPDDGGGGGSGGDAGRR